jgi:hypothetical protein
VKFKPYFGILGSLFFLITTVIGGILYPDYSHIRQYISESYAADATHGFALRWFGFIPSGILFCLFFYELQKKLASGIFSKIGTLGFIFLYGIGTIVCSIFYCDAGCLPEHPSMSQIIHNIAGGLFYLALPLLYLAIYASIPKQLNLLRIATFAVFLSSIPLILLFFKFFDSDFKGLLQRSIEGSLLVWICVMDYQLKNKV